MLKIDKKIKGDSCIVTLDGKVDMTTSMKLEDELAPLEGTVKELILDLSGLVYISSAGLRVLVAAQKMMNSRGKMIIKNPRSSVMEIFKVTGMDRILQIGN